MPWSSVVWPGFLSRQKEVCRERVRVRHAEHLHQEQSRIRDEWDLQKFHEMAGHREFSLRQWMPGVFPHCFGLE